MTLVMIGVAALGGCKDFVGAASFALAGAVGSRFSVYTNRRHACRKLSGVFCSPNP
jgi:hypothetical protein